MATTLVRRVMLRIVADDGNTQEKLDRIAAKAEELGRLNPEIKVKIDAAAAVAEMAVLRKVLKAAADTAGDGGDGTGLTSMLGRAGQALATLASGLIPGAAQAFGSLGTALSSTQIAGISLSVWALAAAPLIAALVVGLTPLIAGLGLVTAGFAAFGAGAVGEISKVLTAQQNLTAAQQAYAKATTAAGRQSALRAEKLATEGLTGSEKNLLGMLGSLQREFGKLQKAVQPEVIKAFGEGLKIIRDLMPALIPLAIGAGKALDWFLKQIGHWLNSPAGKHFIHWMKTEGPVAIKTFTGAMWGLTQFLGHWAANFYHWGQAIDKYWKITVHDIAFGLDTLRQNLVASGHNVETWANNIGHWTMNAVHWFQQLPGRIGSALGGLPGLLFRIGQNALLGLLHGLQSQAGGILSWAQGFVGNLLGIMARAAGIGSPSRITYWHGQMLGAGLIAGMDSARPGVTAAAARLAHAGLPGGYGAHGGGQLTIRLEWAGGGAADHEFITWLQRNIRVRGGSPAIITQKVKFA